MQTGAVREMAGYRHVGERTPVNERRSKGLLSGRGLEEQSSQLYCEQRLGGRNGSDVEGDDGREASAFLYDEKLEIH